VNPPPPVGTFRPIGALLVESAAYLDADWDGRLWSAPAGGRVRVSRKKAGAREEYALRDAIAALPTRDVPVKTIDSFSTTPCLRSIPRA